MMDADAASQSWMVRALAWVVGVMGVGFTALLVWVFQDVRGDIKGLQDCVTEHDKSLATKVELETTRVKLAGLVSRRELMAHLKVFEEREERKHEENLDTIGAIRADVRMLVRLATSQSAEEER